MSQSIWTVQHFGPSTIDQAHHALRKVRAGWPGWGFETTTRFLGYLMERFRQGTHRTTAQWAGGADRSGHRYAQGRNRDNYMRVGRRLLEGMAERFGLRPGAPAEMVWDAMEDQEGGR
jgi:hypothetical protein